MLPARPDLASANARAESQPFIGPTHTTNNKRSSIRTGIICFTGSGSIERRRLRSPFLNVVKNLTIDAVASHIPWTFASLHHLTCLVNTSYTQRRDSGSVPPYRSEFSRHDVEWPPYSKGYDEVDGTKRENGAETVLPVAKIGLADTVFLEFRKVR